MQCARERDARLTDFLRVALGLRNEILVSIAEDVLVGLALGPLLVGCAESSLGTGLRLGGRLCALQLQVDLLVVVAVDGGGCLGGALALWRRSWRVAVLGLALGLALG